MLTYESLLAHIDGKYLYDQTSSLGARVHITTNVVRALYTQYQLGIEVPNVRVKGTVYELPATRTSFPYIWIHSVHPSLIVHAHRVINTPGDEWLITLSTKENSNQCAALINYIKD